MGCVLAINNSYGSRVKIKSTKKPKLFEIQTSIVTTPVLKILSTKFSGAIFYVQLEMVPLFNEINNNDNLFDKITKFFSVILSDFHTVRSGLHKGKQFSFH